MAMDVVITIERTIKQYQDITVHNVESEAHARAVVEKQLTDPVQRARMARNATAWYTGEEMTPAALTKSASVDDGVDRV